MIPLDQYKITGVLEKHDKLVITRIAFCLQIATGITTRVKLPDTGKIDKKMVVDKVKTYLGIKEIDIEFPERLKNTLDLAP